jgi:hypothetical protein
VVFIAQKLPEKLNMSAGLQPEPIYFRRRRRKRLTSLGKILLQCLYFYKISSAEQKCVVILYIAFHPNRSRSVKSTGRNKFTTLSKVRLSLHRLLQKSRLKSVVFGEVTQLQRAPDNIGDFNYTVVKA